MLVSRDFGAFETRQSCLVLSSGAQVLNLKVFHALSSGSRLSGCAAYERKRAPYELDRGVGDWSAWLRRPYVIAITVLCSTLNPEARSRTPTPHLLCKTQSQKSSQLRLREQFGVQGLKPALRRMSENHAAQTLEATTCKTSHICLTPTQIAPALSINQAAIIWMMHADDKDDDNHSDDDSRR